MVSCWRYEVQKQENKYHELIGARGGDVGVDFFWYLPIWLKEENGYDSEENIVGQMVTDTWHEWCVKLGLAEWA